MEINLITDEGIEPNLEKETPAKLVTKIGIDMTDVWISDVCMEGACLV